MEPASTRRHLYSPYPIDVGVHKCRLYFFLKLVYFLSKTDWVIAEKYFNV